MYIFIIFSNFHQVEDLASVLCEWVEMELRHDNWEESLKLLQRGPAPPSREVSYHDQGETVQMRLHKSLKGWSLYTDHEESFWTATPQIIIK